MPPGQHQVQHRHYHLLPFVAVAAGIASFSVMDALMKGASLAVGAYSAMLFRSLISAVVMLPVVGVSAWRVPELRGLSLEELSLEKSDLDEPEENTEPGLGKSELVKP